MRAHRHTFVGLVAALGLVALAGPAVALPEPELAVSLGRSFAVGTGTSGAFNQGGFTTSLAALWPWESHFRFGANIFMTDLGYRVEDIVLADPSGGPSLDYGTIERGQRNVWGAAWRADVLGPELGMFGRGYGTAQYGYFRFQDAHTGHTFRATSAVGGMLGLGVEHALTAHQTLRLVAGATFMSDTFTKHYGSAALEWGWRR